MITFNLNSAAALDFDTMQAVLQVHKPTDAPMTFKVVCGGVHEPREDEHTISIKVNKSIDRVFSYGGTVSSAHDCFDLAGCTFREALHDALMGIFGAYGVRVIDNDLNS